MRASSIRIVLAFPLALGLALAAPRAQAANGRPAAPPALALPAVKDLARWDGRAPFFGSSVASPVVVLARSPTGARRFRGYGADGKTSRFLFVVEGEVDQQLAPFLAQINRELAEQALHAERRPNADFCMGVFGSPLRPLVETEGPSHTGQIGQPTPPTDGPPGGPSFGKPGDEPPDAGIKRTLLAFLRLWSRQRDALYATKTASSGGQPPGGRPPGPKDGKLPQGIPIPGKH